MSDMSEIVRLGTNSVQWIEGPNEIDRSFLDEVPLIPEKMVQGVVNPLMGSAVDKLFEYEFPQSWAFFVPFKEYQNSLRRLFKHKVLSSFDTNFAKDQLDNFLEDEESEDGEKIYAMLEELGNLNAVLEEIYNKILSCLKP